MRCATARQWISDRLDGWLDSEQEAELRRHLEICPECRELVHDFEAIIEQAKGLAELEPSPSVWPKILAGVQAARGASELPPRRETGWLAAFWRAGVLRYAAAALALLIVGGLVVRLGPWRGAGSEKGSAAFTIAKLEEAQRHYEKAIQSLSEAVAAQKNGMNPELAEIFQRNLEAMDATIRASRALVEKDPDNLAVRAYLLTAYREKVSFLEEMMGVEKASGSAKKEVTI